MSDDRVCAVCGDPLAEERRMIVREFTEGEDGKITMGRIYHARCSDSFSDLADA